MLTADRSATRLMTRPAAATKLNKAMSTFPRSTPNMTAGEHSASP